MNTDPTQFAASSNGDTWSLATAEGTAVEVVIHCANKASGGHETQTPISEFLDQRPLGPEHEALVAILQQRVAPKAASYGSGVQAVGDETREERSAPEIICQEVINRASIGGKIGNSSVRVEVQMTSVGLLAAGFLVSSILLSIVPIVTVATRHMRRR